MQGKLLAALKILFAVIAVVVGAGFAWLSLPFSGFKSFSVQTGSMRPSINPGDLVLVQRVPAPSLQVGDVITYTTRSGKRENITHRLIGIQNDSKGAKTYLVQGDANQVADRPLRANQVIGKVQYHVPYAGRVLDFMRHPLGLLILIYVPALIVVIGEMRLLIKFYRKQQPYIAAEIEKRFKNFKRGKTWANGAKVSVLLLVFLLAIAAPVAQATLFTKSIVAGNTISVAATVPTLPVPTPVPLTPTPTLTPTPADHVVIARVSLRCWDDNSATANVRPRIVLFNSTNNIVDISGWRLDDNAGTIATVPGHTTLEAQETYELKPYTSHHGFGGLQYTGDRVILHNAQSVVVDGISWGTDTTAFVPGFAALTPGARMQRTTPTTDNNSAADFSLEAHTCKLHERDTDNALDDPRNHDDDEPTQEGDCGFARGRNPR